MVSECSLQIHQEQIWHPCPIYVAIVPSLITMRLIHILEELVSDAMWLLLMNVLIAAA